MAFDFKKEYKEFYLPKNKPEIIAVPKMRYAAVSGSGNPNEEGGSYKQAVAILYAVSYTLKMSYLGSYKIDGYFPYVVPPLEGFWWQEGIKGIDYTNKNAFNWVSVIRVPEFVNETDFEWACAEAEKKKQINCSAAKLLTIDEGLCVQIMHLGSYDSEPQTLKIMDEFIMENGFVNDFSATRLHHEIYLSDPRKTDASKLKTVIRHPVKPL